MHVERLSWLLPDCGACIVPAVRYCCPENDGKKLIVIQIEALGALQDLDEFLRVDGIDTYSLSPVDLAKSLGFAGDYRRLEGARRTSSVHQRVLNCSCFIK